MALKRTDREYLDLWREFCDNIDNATPIDVRETHQEKLRRIARLEADDEAWFKYYFPSFYTSEPAPFHTKATRRVMKNPEWYEVRSWARELSKSGRTMMESLKLILTGKKRNLLMVSNSADNGERLLLPYKANLESNNRIINDYGVQRKVGAWESAEFKTRKGASFRAIGAGQSPRGTRNDAVRPDIILVDDIDTDELCRNPELVDERIKWIEQALIPTRSVSNGLLLIACGNIIARKCCIKAMGEKADKWDVVNILDDEGNSTWPQKNTQEMIERVLSTISYASAQKEYFNNPMDTTDTFPEMHYESLPQLRHCDHVVIYADPAPSNSDRGKNSQKCVVIVGAKNRKYGVYRVWLNHMGNDTFVRSMFEAHEMCRTAGVDPINIYIENNTLQNPFYEQVLLPQIFKIGAELKIDLPIREDDTKKPDKHVRVEGTLEPLNRLGNLVLNLHQKNNPNMQRLEAQFTGFTFKSKLIDGPDAVQGAVKIIQNKQATQAVGAVECFKRKSNDKRF